MLFVIITCIILYIIIYSLLYYLYIEYKQDYKELEERILQLEKRIEDYKKKENNTQESGEYDMPCGRKKGRGGRRK